MIYPLLAFTVLGLGLTVAGILHLRPLTAGARQVRRFRRNLDRLEVVTAFWRECLPEDDHALRRYRPGLEGDEAA